VKDPHRRENQPCAYSFLTCSHGGDTTNDGGTHEHDAVVPSIAYVCFLSGKQQVQTTSNVYGICMG
jgi:hypothetical protein